MGDNKYHKCFLSLVDRLVKNRPSHHLLRIKLQHLNHVTPIGWQNSNHIRKICVSMSIMLRHLILNLRSCIPI